MSYWEDGNVSNLEFHLDHFDGPMDLLMHLIEKNRIDIYDIPISDLTQQYLMYLEDAKSMNLEIASHFLLMASQLIRVKIKMLLPKRRNEEDSEDPRTALVDQIVAYKFFKSLSHDLEEVQYTASKYYARTVDMKAMSEKYKKIETPKGLDANVLYNAFKLLEDYSREKTQVMVVEKMSFSIEALKEELLAFCQESSYPTFQNVLKSCRNVEEMITFFLALLECIRRDEIVAVQHEMFGDIWLQRVAV